MQTDLRGASVRLLARTGENHATLLTLPALVLAMTMHPSLVGPQGDPAINLAAVAGDALDLPNTQGLVMMSEVVHSSHEDWQKGGVIYAYELTAPEQAIAPVDYDAIAGQVAHEANRTIAALFGDRSFVPWQDAPQTVRDSIMSGVMLIKHSPGIQPWDQHNAWVNTRLAEGWKYGPERSVENKTHPSLVPWEQMTPADQAKDWLFNTIVRAALGMGPMDLSYATGVPLLPKDQIGCTLDSLLALTKSLKAINSSLPLTPDILPATAAGVIDQLAAQNREFADAQMAEDQEKQAKQAAAAKQLSSAATAPTATTEAPSPEAAAVNAPAAETGGGKAPVSAADMPDQNTAQFQNAAEIEISQAANFNSETTEAVAGKEPELAGAAA